jgi:lipoic acid synthetase
VNQDEPQQVADSVAALGLRHVVVTSVTRDDFPDGGASVFVETIRAIRAARPGTGVEVLIPDFRGSERALMQVIEARPDVIGHNLETVSRLYPSFRQGASYQRSLEILRVIRDSAAGTITKSGLMVGVGETREEVIEAMEHLAGAGCTVVTLGQYLRPSRRHHPVAEFVPPAGFAELARLGEAAGIPMVVAGPLVRSSYQAGRIFERLSGSMAANQVGG